MGRPRRGVARDTRKLILDAAVDLLAERGARGTSMRALAAAVGLRESALYHHFSSKNELLRAALSPPEADTAGAGEAQAPAPGARGPTDLERPLEEIFLAFAQQLATSFGTPRRRKQLRALLAAGGSPDADAWRSLSDEPRRRLARLLLRLRRAGRVREDLELDVVFLQVFAPLLFATGILVPGSKAPIAIPLTRFLQGQSAMLALALAPTRRRH
jgi:AcrR family transcriptional regulator